MATYSLQAFSSLARASLVSRQVADLVSSAPLLMNATSPYRVSSESRAVVAQVDSLLDTIGQDKNAETPNNVPSDDIVQLLQAIRQQTLPWRRTRMRPSNTRQRPQRHWGKLRQASPLRKTRFASA